MKNAISKRGMRQRVLTVLAATLALTASITTAAQADSHSGGSNYFDGRSPIAAPEYCNRNAKLIATRPVTERDTGRQVATLEIYYSYTCQSNWIRVTGNPYGGGANKYITSDLGGWNSEADPGYGSSYSMLVYAPGTTRISGWVYLYEPGIEEYNWRANATFSL